MEIKQGLELKENDLVYCPPDRGNKGFNGVVIGKSASTNVNIHGIEYLWITVRELGSNKSAVWPSNRLSKIV